MTAQNAASATDTARPDLFWMLSKLESEMLNLCALADALIIIGDALPGLNGTEAPYEKKAFHAIGAMLGLMAERADLVYEISAQTALIAAKPARMT